MNEEIQEEIIEESPEEGLDEESDEESEETPEETPKEVQEDELDLTKLEIETRQRGEEKIEYPEDIDPDDVKTIGTIVEKQTASVKKALQEAQDRAEVDAFVQERPEFAKYKPVILKYLQHPVYSSIPVKNIAAIVASNDLLKLGAVKEREAQAKADSTKDTGNPVRKPDSGVTDWSRASKEEFESQKRKVLGMQ